VNKKVLKTCI